MTTSIEELIAKLPHDVRAKASSKLIEVLQGFARDKAESKNLTRIAAEELKTSATNQRRVVKGVGPTKTHKS